MPGLHLYAMPTFLVCFLRAWPCCSAPIVASQLLLVDEVLRAGMNMRRQ